jgi:hypothetical protein
VRGKGASPQWTSAGIPTRRERATCFPRRMIRLNPRGEVAQGSYHSKQSRSPHGHGVREREMYDRRGLELLEESQVVFVEETDVINAVLQHCQALGAHPKRETCVRLRIVTDEAVQGGVHHPRP